MSSALLSWITEIPTWLIAALSAAATWVLKPIIDTALASYLARKPRFGLVDARRAGDVTVEVEALNRLANKKKPLNALVNGVYFRGAGILVAQEPPYRWHLNLNRSPLIAAELVDKKECTATFFFDGGPHSDQMLIRLRDELDEEPVARGLQYCNSFEAFIRCLASNKSFNLTFGNETIRHILPSKADNFRWVEVYDGKELLIENLNNVEILGNNARILAKPKYAWVMNFSNCGQIVLDHMVLGHLEEGYCRGGVLRFYNCKDIIVRTSDLFGCGTYGIELSGCRNVHFEQCVVRDCSYGILQIEDCANVKFNQCQFTKNREFDLIEIRGDCKDIGFIECSFKQNVSRGHFVFLDEGATEDNIDFARCEFSLNQAAGLSNLESDLEESALFGNSVMRDNHFAGRSWRQGG